MEDKIMEILVYRPEEVSKVLKIGIPTVMDKLHNGEIPAYKDGASWKIPVKTLEEYVIDKALEETKARRKTNEEE
jgi:excisionase family DNA binding protein